MFDQHKNLLELLLNVSWKSGNLLGWICRHNQYAMGWKCIQQHISGIQYKVALIAHKALSTYVPLYLDELLQCQETTRVCYGPLTLCACLFQGHVLRQPCGRSVWPLLTSETHCRSTFSTPTMSTFRNKLKTHFLQHLIHDETYPPQRLCI